MCYGYMAFAAGTVFGMIVARKPVGGEKEPVNPRRINDQGDFVGSDVIEQ